MLFFFLIILTLTTHHHRQQFLHKIYANLFIFLFYEHLEHVDDAEAKAFFEANYSHIFYILHETFDQAEANLKQRGEFIN